MTSIRKVMSPEQMADNCLAALEAHGLATRPENRMLCQRVMEFWIENFLVEHGGTSMDDILVWASVSKAWRLRILAKQPQMMALMCPERPAFQETDLPPCGNMSVLRDLDIAVTDAIRDHREISANSTLNIQALTRVTECIAALSPVFFAPIEWRGEWQGLMCKLEGDGLVWETLCPIIRRGRSRVLFRLLHSLQHALRHAEHTVGR